MIYKLYCIKDIIAGKFYDIMLFDNEEVAIRFFVNFANESKFSKDLYLFRLGEFDAKLGKINSIDPEFVMSGGDLRVDS